MKLVDPETHPFLINNLALFRDVGNRRSMDDLLNTPFRLEYGPFDYLSAHICMPSQNGEAYIVKILIRTTHITVSTASRSLGQTQHRPAQFAQSDMP